MKDLYQYRAGRFVVEDKAAELSNSTIAPWFYEVAEYQGARLLPVKIRNFTLMLNLRRLVLELSSSLKISRYEISSSVSLMACKIEHCFIPLENVSTASRPGDLLLDGLPIAMVQRIGGSVQPAQGIAQRVLPMVAPTAGSNAAKA